jgi:hypothetical protein
MQLEQLHPDCWFHICAQFDLWDTKQTMVILRVSKRMSDAMLPHIKAWLNNVADLLTTDSETENDFIGELLCSIKFHSREHLMGRICTFLRASTDAMYYLHHIIAYETRNLSFDMSPIYQRNYEDRLSRLVIRHNNNLSFLTDTHGCEIIEDVLKILPQEAELFRVDRTLKDEDLERVKENLLLTLNFERVMALYPFSHDL